MISHLIDNITKCTQIIQLKNVGMERFSEYQIAYEIFYAFLSAEYWKECVSVFALCETVMH